MRKRWRKPYRQVTRVTTRIPPWKTTAWIVTRNMLLALLLILLALSVLYRRMSPGRLPGPSHHHMRQY